VATWQRCKRVLGIFTLSMRRKRLFRNFRSKHWPRHSLRRPRFPIRQMNFTTEWRLRDIFDVFVLLRRMTLWPWPFDLQSVSCTVLFMSDPHTNLYYPTSIGYWVTSTEYLITFPSSETVTAQAPCHVTYITGGGAKIVRICEIPDPTLPIHFVTFRALRRRLSHVIGEK